MMRKLTREQLVQLQRESTSLSLELEALRGKDYEWNLVSKAIKLVGNERDALKREVEVLRSRINGLVKRNWFLVDEGQADIVRYVQMELKDALTAADKAKEGE